jgi:hypothetical protein
MSDNNALIVATFRTHSTVNQRKTKEAGRPIYDDIEVCEIRMAANKQTVAVFPAHEVWKWQDKPDGGREQVTYAMRFKDQYQRFKEGLTQTQSGTPLEELPFLTQSKRLELKALNIYTAESLAALDGQPLKLLGVGGRELKNQAQAYLDNAKGSADVTKLAGENELLKQQIADLRAEFQSIRSAAPAQSPMPATPFDDMDADSIKEWIYDATGQRPRGNPSIDTLKRMAVEINDEMARAKAPEAA